MISTRPRLDIKLEKKTVDLLLDSGAFSAWRQRTKIRVEDYIEFCHRYPGIFQEIVNLDVIPGGGFGKMPSAAEVDQSASEGWRNMETMRKYGIKPMHVFHMGESFSWLKRMLDEGLDYIGISPANDRTSRQKIKWLDEVFGFLCGDKGYPQVRTHGFGVTSLPILFRYPWFSADSVSWILFGAYGQILIPKPKPEGGYDYTKSPYVIHVSNRGKDDKFRRPAGAVALDLDSNIDHMGTMMREYIQGYLDHEGFNLQEARDTHMGRLKVNCRFYKRIAEQTKPQPFFQKRTLLDSKPSPYGQVTCPFEKLKLVFTTTGADEDSGLMNQEGIRDRLISYYHIRDDTVVDLPYYVETGICRPGPKAKPKRKRKALVELPQELPEV